MPSYIPITPEFMNYASVVFVAFFIVSTAWYFIWGVKHYAGPPVQDDEAIDRRLSHAHVI